MTASRLLVASEHIHDWRTRGTAGYLLTMRIDRIRARAVEVLAVIVTSAGAAWSAIVAADAWSRGDLLTAGCILLGWLTALAVPAWLLSRVR